MADCRFTQCSLGYVHSATSVCSHGERFSYDLEMKTRQQNRNNKRTEIERFDWFIERIQTHLAFGWLSERSAEKTSCLKNFLEINRYFALTSYCNTIGQSNNAFSILGFSLARKRPCFDLFIYWLITQITNAYRNYFSRLYENRSNLNTEQLNTQFFKWSRIRKSL